MSEVFLVVLNMSLIASWAIIFVSIVRFLLKKAPKFISYALWSVVAFRLIIPFSFESLFSLMPWNTNSLPIPHDIMYEQHPQLHSGIVVVDSFVSASLPALTTESTTNPLQLWAEVGGYIWVVGIVTLLTYSVVSIIILKKQLRSATLIEQNMYESANLRTPFVLGLLRPNIYLPVGLQVEERNYIVLHERTHIRRKDHIIKIIAFFIVAIHWFNPLVWMAFILMGMDMELSCDERVLKDVGKQIKKPYATSLLALATGKHMLNGSPLAFSEGNVKRRVINVLNYRKPRFWFVVVTVTIAFVVGIGLVANPANIAAHTEVNHPSVLEDSSPENEKQALEEYQQKQQRDAAVILGDHVLQAKEEDRLRQEQERLSEISKLLCTLLLSLSQNYNPM